MFKKILKIIGILIVVFLIVLGIIWLIGRHKAAENNKTPLTFKQFIGLSSKNGNGSNGGTGGDLSSTFTGNGNGSGSNGSGDGTGSGNLSTSGNGVPGGVGDDTNVSNFTDGGLSLGGGVETIGTGSNGSGGNGNGNTNGSGGNGNGSGNGNNGSGGDNGSGGISTAPVCGTADTTITFTPEELTELNNLQNRFYSLAQSLHTDADVATELANHDAFALKADQVTEMYNYCESQISTPTFTSDPRLEKRVATPFWFAWNIQTDPNVPDLWTPAGSPPDGNDSLMFLYFPSQNDLAYLTQVHDNNDSFTGSCKINNVFNPSKAPCNPNNADASGISGPFGELDFADPQEVPINGSVLKPDSVLMFPVVERILRVNLW